MAYFHPCPLSGNDLDDLETALRAEIRRDYVLVVSAAGQMQYRSATTRTLVQMVHLASGATRLSKLVSVAEVVGAPPRQRGGRPSLHRSRLYALLVERAAHGLAENGRNEEAKAVLHAYGIRNQNTHPPKLSTMKAYVSEWMKTG